MRKIKLRELGEAIRALLKGPYTSKFPKELPSLPEGFRGKPKYNEDECVGCTACAQVCPPGAITFEDDGDTRRLQVDYGMCIFCGQCERYCISEGGIKLSDEFLLATIDTAQLPEGIEHELIRCQLCGAPISTRRHILWVYKRLGTLAYGNPTVSMVALETLGLSKTERRIPDLPHTRADRMRVLCPYCRREILMKEVWGYKE